MGQGEPTEWEGELGNHNNMNTHQFVPPEILERMHHDDVAPNHFDSTGMGPGDDQGDKKMDNKVPLDFGRIIPEEDDGSVCIVNKYNHDYFYDRLVKHFYIKWQCDEVYWPRANS